MSTRQPTNVRAAAYGHAAMLASVALFVAQVTVGCGQSVLDWLTAIGTIGAAGFAGYAAITSGGAAAAAQRAAAAAEHQAKASRAMIKVARDQVAAAQEQAEVARQSLSVQVQPVLIDEPLQLAVEERTDFPDGPLTVHPGGIVVSSAGDTARLSFPVRNMGRGPAEIRGVGVRLTGRDGQRVEGPACNEVSRGVLPVGETSRLNFWFGAAEFGPRWDAWVHTVTAYGSFTVLVRYADLSGGAHQVSHFVVQRRERAHYGWEVRRVLVEPAAATEAEERAYAEAQRGKA
jgi:hypothetical protein